MKDMDSTHGSEGGGVEEAVLPCFRCGICCTRYPIHLDLMDARRIADGLRMDWTDFQDKYLVRNCPGVDRFNFVRPGGVCNFLEREEGGTEALCGIHAFRPYACEAWTSGPFRRECREGLERWGLSVGPSGELQGSEEKLRDFRAFLTSREEGDEKRGSI